jgi:hypothetical protein
MATHVCSTRTPSAGASAHIAEVEASMDDDRQEIVKIAYRDAISSLH